MPEEYTVDIADLKAYLATLQPGDEAGVTSHMRYCLVAKALDYKYGERFLVNGSHFSLVNTSDPWHILPNDVLEIVEEFDELHVDQHPVSRQEVEEAIPVLKGDN